ncbi:MAG: hypothetical protein HKN16_11380, partial [Saprospiraceae bacterium]|nr:hypothetical protein [Saprospiraceae bacterium]
MHNRITTLFLFFGLALFLTSCGNDDDFPITPNSGEYFRLKALDVDVLPQFRQVRVLFQATDFYHNGYGALEAEDLDVFENGHLVDLEGEVRLAPDSIPYDLRT